MDSSNAEKATELDGATEVPPENAYPSDSGEFAARWNQHTPEFRDEWVHRMVENSQTAMRCFMSNHEGLLEALAESRARFGDSEARRAELEATIQAVRRWVTTTGYHRAKDLLPDFEVPLVVLEDRDREVAARALEDAAAAIPERMRMDELGMSQVTYTHELPQLSRVMLNGGTRFAERLTERAAAIRKGDTNA